MSDSFNSVVVAVVDNHTPENVVVSVSFEETPENLRIFTGEFIASAVKKFGHAEVTITVDYFNA